jgi:hypothetical protein
MAAKTPIVRTPAIDTSKAEQAVSTLVPRAQSVTVTDEASYQLADSLLARISTARADWKADTATVLDPINAARTAAMELRAKYDGPLKLGEDRLREGMRQFRLSENRRIQQEEEKKRQEQLRQDREAEEKRQAAENARTPQMKGKLLAEAARLEERADLTAAAPISRPVQAAHSGQRVTRKCRMKDGQWRQILKGILDGVIPADVVSIQDSTINAYFKSAPAEVSQWPGVEVFDDVDIVRRRGL